MDAAAGAVCGRGRQRAVEAIDRRSRDFMVMVLAVSKARELDSAQSRTRLSRRLHIRHEFDPRNYARRKGGS